jgi:predicted amidophosphoribosyltransferase
MSRGYSPAGLIVSNMLSALEPRFGFSSRKFFGGQTMLRRKVETKDQASLGQQDRHQNLIGAMVASNKARGKRVLLVDDIVTTGSSLLESARALTEGGAEVIGFLTFAETILRKNAKSVTR